MVKKFLKDEQGQDIVEYSLLLALIGTAALLVLTVMGQSITNIFTMVRTVLEQLKGLTKPQRKFLLALLATILTGRGKVNFLNLSRYCAYSEKTLRRQFRQPFDFTPFKLCAVSTLKP